MTAREKFKSDYGNFRKRLTSSIGNHKAYENVWMSNPLFAHIKSRTIFPVSLKIWSYYHHKNKQLQS